MTGRFLLLALFVASSVGALAAQGPAPAPDWKSLEDESMRHYQALLRFDTSATEKAAAEYLKQVLDQSGIPAQILFKDPERPNVLARLKGTGRKRPLLLMAHIDTVTVDATKWRFPPFSATRDGGYVYGRGAIDDKDNLAAALMTMVLLKRQNVPLDRDVIFLAESGEEGASNLGIGYMMAEHYPEIDAEYLHRRRRRRSPRGRGGALCHRPDHREGGARRGARRAWHLRARLGAAQVQRHRPPRQCGGTIHRLAARHQDR